MLKQLTEVNRAVNRFKYVPDIKRYQRKEFWNEIDAEGGDCEDYALEKRRRLIAAGVPADRLKLAVCITETGEYHAVLTADDPDADETYVLDNRHRDVKTWKSLPYKWVMRQSGKEWVTIE